MDDIDLNQITPNSYTKPRENTYIEKATAPLKDVETT